LSGKLFHSETTEYLKPLDANTAPTVVLQIQVFGRRSKRMNGCVTKVGGVTTVLLTYVLVAGNNQSLDLYNGAINSTSDNDDETEAPDAAIVNQRRIETDIPQAVYSSYVI